MRAVLVSVLLAASVAQAADPGLMRFLEAGDSDNLDRRLSAQQRARAEWDLRQAWTSLLPSLTATAGWTNNQYEAVATFPTGPTTSTKLTIMPRDQLDAILRFEVPLVDTQRWMRTVAAGESQAASVERELAVRGVVMKQVAGAYYGYAAALAVRQSAQKSLSVAEALEKLMVARHAVGAVTELDLLRSNAEVQRSRQVVADTENLVATMRRALHTLSGLEPPAAVPLPTDDLRVEQGLEVLQARVDDLPGVKAAERDARAAGAMAMASRLSLVPMVNGQFTQRFTNATGFQGQGAVYNLGVNLVWRLDAQMFQGMGGQATTATMAELASDKLRLQARDQIHADWQRLEAARVKVEAARTMVEVATRASKMAGDRYAAGASTQMDVILADREAFGAEVMHIQARTELATARVMLRISAGLPLE